MKNKNAVSPGITEVKDFWEKNPLYSGEAGEKTNSMEFIRNHEEKAIEECFAGKVENFYFQGLQGKRVLDVGCGIGFWVRQFARRGIDIWAVDLTLQGVSITRASLPAEGLSARVCVGNAEELPLSAESFDHLNSQGVIHHTPHTEKCIQEFARVLRPGGSLCVSVYRKSFLLRHAWVFRILKALDRKLSIGLPGRGRESMLKKAATAEDLVRFYDGEGNPIGKSYTDTEFKTMLAPYFDIKKIRRHYFPARALPFAVPPVFRRFLHSRAGLMTVIQAVKKRKAIPV